MTFLRPLAAPRAYHGSRLLAGVCAALLAAAAVAPATLAAQATAPRTLVSINPLGLPFKMVSGELEQKVNGFATIGGSVSYLDVGDESYTSLEAKFRLYPNEEAFQGFSIGLAAGIARLSEDRDNGNGDSSRSATNPSVAVIADYNWLLGKNKRVVVGTGIGAKRVFGDDDGFSEVNFAYPTLRFQVGVTF